MGLYKYFTAHKRPKVPGINNADRNNGVPKHQNPTPFVLAERQEDGTLKLVDTKFLKSLSGEKTTLLASVVLGTFYQLMSNLYSQDRQLVLDILEDDIAHNNRRRSQKFIEISDASDKKRARKSTPKPRKKRTKK